MTRQSYRVTKVHSSIVLIRQRQRCSRNEFSMNSNPYLYYRSVIEIVYLFQLARYHILRKYFQIIIYIVVLASLLVKVTSQVIFRPKVGKRQFQRGQKLAQITQKKAQYIDRITSSSYCQRETLTLVILVVLEDVYVKYQSLSRCYCINQSFSSLVRQFVNLSSCQLSLNSSLDTNSQITKNIIFQQNHFLSLIKSLKVSITSSQNRGDLTLNVDNLSMSSFRVPSNILGLTIEEVEGVEEEVLL